MEYRFFFFFLLSDTKDPPRWIHAEKQDLWQVESDLSTCLKHVQENYIRIGFLLRRIKADNLFAFSSYESEDGSVRPCKNVEEYAFFRFGLSKTVVHNAIAIVERFIVGGDSIGCNEEKAKLYPGLSGFGYSALCELVSLSKDPEMTSPTPVNGYLPDEIRKEVTPEMTVCQIRKVKKRLKGAKSKRCEKPEEDPEKLERHDDECAEEKISGSFRILRNDQERKFVFEHYRKWDVFSQNVFLGLTYYRVYLGKNVYAVAIEWTDPDPYYQKTSGGLRVHFHYYEKDKPFSLDTYSVGQWQRIIREKKLMCVSDVWDRMHEDE